MVSGMLSGDFISSSVSRSSYHGRILMFSQYSLIFIIISMYTVRSPAVPFCSDVTLKLSVNLVLFVIEPLRLVCVREFGLVNLLRFSDEGFFCAAGDVVSVDTLSVLLFSCSNSEPRLVVTDESVELFLFSSAVAFGEFVCGGGGGGGGGFGVVGNVLVIVVCFEAGGGGGGVFVVFSVVVWFEGDHLSFE